MFNVTPKENFSGFTEGKVYKVLETGTDNNGMVSLVLPNDEFNIMEISSMRFKYVPEAFKSGSVIVPKVTASSSDTLEGMIEEEKEEVPARPIKPASSSNSPKRRTRGPNKKSVPSKKPAPKS